MRIGSFDGASWDYGIRGIPEDGTKKVVQEINNPVKPDLKEQEKDGILDSRSERKQINPLNLQDISLDKNTGSSFDFIGRDSDISSLDVQKAVSDMKRDRILEDYQYFVGDIHIEGKQPEINPEQSPENSFIDGIVIQK